MHYSLILGASAALLVSLLVPSGALAVRPFVTDDARVVGARRGQLETWLQYDRLALAHNVFVAYGPTDWLEVGLGLTHGVGHSGPDRGYSITGPVAQAKSLLLPAKDNGWPGLALAAGIVPAFGSGVFAPTGWSGFVYAAVTHSSLEEAILIHADIGMAAGEDSSSRGTTATVTAGLGVDVKVVAGLHAIGEAYYGDPYALDSRYPAAQLGVRYIFSEHVQVDCTVSSSLESIATETEMKRVERWATLGLRLVSPEL